VAGFHTATDGKSAYLETKRVQNSWKSDQQSRPAQPPTCPECGSSRTWKDGLRRTRAGFIQRWLCRDCSYRFSEPTLNNKRTNPHITKRQVCAYDEEAKNLVKVETRTETGQREATTDVKSLLFNFAWWLTREGYKESTIERRVRILRTLASRGADLNNPESVKDLIAMQKNWASACKEIAVTAYTSFLVSLGKTWNPPFYKRVEKLPFIPMESEIDNLIAGCGGQISTFLQLLKETAMRSGEAYQLRWKDVDLERGVITVTPEKGSRPRIFKISNKLQTMISRLDHNRDGPFGYGDLNNLRATFERQRKALAFKLGNFRLKEICFKTLRHWKATMLYHQTKDVLYVMRFLGHRNIKNTLVYIQLEEALFQQEAEEYVCKVAETVDEAKPLIEAGFEYVCEVDHAKLFKRRK